MASDIVRESIEIDQGNTTVIVKPRGPSRYQILSNLYALPIPLRTYPLPTFVPSNPLSLFHLVYTWLSHTFSPPSSHPEVLYEGWFSPESRTVHIADPKTIRALWEQGFFGKGTLSRSEPSWLEREKKRKGAAATETSEEYTNKRRAERQQIKWERARKERQAIDQKLEEERKATELQKLELPQEQDDLTTDTFLSSVEESSHVATANGVVAMELSYQPSYDKPNQSNLASAPVDPMQLLRLPNSDRELLGQITVNDDIKDKFDYEEDLEKTINELESLMAEAMNGTEDADIRLQQLEELVSGIISDLPPEFEKADQNDEKDAVPYTIEAAETSHKTILDSSKLLDNHTESRELDGVAQVNGSTFLNSFAVANDEPLTPKLIRSPKSVRFSPTVEETTFLKSSPPSPEAASFETELVLEDITNQEHLQLTMEETLFLSYGLGVLKVIDPSTHQPISNSDLFQLCRMSSYFPPKVDFSPSPDDPFMLSYVVYHHFRSLGWVVRSGIKFSVDFLLYNRGPVFTHSEFSILILPSYSHAYWKENEERKRYVEGKEKRDWHWLHSINRVNTQIKKSLVLVYVDIPPPVEAEEEQKIGITGVLGRYGVREMVINRWLYNRQRK